MNELILIPIIFHCRNLLMFYLPTVSSYPHLTFSVGKTKSKLGYPVVPIDFKKEREPWDKSELLKGQRGA